MIPGELLTASVRSQRCPTNTSIGGADSEMQRRVTSVPASSSSRHPFGVTLGLTIVETKQVYIHCKSKAEARLVV